MPVTSANITGSDQDNTDSTGIRGGTDGTIIGNTSDALKTINASIGAGGTAGTAGTSSTLIGGVYATTSPTLTNGQQVAAQLDVNGRLLSTANIKAKRNQTQQLSDTRSIIESSLNDVTADKFGRLETLSLAHSDRSFFRDDFPGAFLVYTLTGTVTFTTSSTAVTGSGTFFTTELGVGHYIKLAAGAETEYRQVKSIESDTAMTLVSAYGTGGSGSTNFTTFAVETPSGGTVTVASSLLTITTGTTNGAIGGVYRQLESGTQFTSFVGTIISQRIANQTLTIGLRSGSSTASRRAEFSFSGTDNTTFSCISSSSTAASNIETTTARFPRGLTSATSNTYKVSILKDRIHFYVNDILVATNRTHMGELTYGLRAYVLVNNTGAAGSSTTVTCDAITSFQNSQVELCASGSPLEVRGTVSAAYVPAIIPMYMSTTGAFTPPATPTDMLYIVGNSTRWIRIRRIELSATQTTAAYNSFYLKKYSTAHSGGTRTTLTAVPMDSQNAAALAGTYNYTANPTLGTLIGTMDIRRVLTPTATTVLANPIVIWDFTQMQEIVLRSTAEGLGVNFNGAALPAGLSISFTVYWSEEVQVW